MRIFLLTYGSLERYRLLGDLKDLANLLFGNVHLCSDLFGARLSSQGLKELTAHTYELVDGLDHVNRNTDGTCLIRDCSGYSLSDPPCCICGELVSLAVIELLNCLDKSEVSFLDQVKEKHSSSHISLGNGYNKSEVSLCKCILGLLISVLHSLGKFNLILC